MGIGISYTNANGVTSAFSAQGATDAMAMLNGIIGQSENVLAAWRAKRRVDSFTHAVNKSKEQRDAERDERDQEQADKRYAKFSGMTYKQWKAQQADKAANGAVNPAGRKIGAVQAVKDFVKKIVTFNGALEEKFSKLALKGESTARNGGIFGKSIRGAFGFFDFDSFDEPKVGRNASNALDTDDDPQGGDKKANENVPWCEDFVTRVFVSGGSQDSSETEVAPKILKFGYRNRKMTAGGREFALGEEQVLDVCRLDTIGGSSVSPGCYELTISDSGGSFANQYFRVGGKTYETNLAPPLTDGIMCLVIDATGSEPSAAITTYATLSIMKTAENSSLSSYICPLYTLDDEKIVCDWRKGAICVMSEF